MIPLFNIPAYKIDTARFTSLLHDPVIERFEKAFAAFVGARYAVSLNSATSALFLIFNQYGFSIDDKLNIELPSVLPPVVANALLNANCSITFKDDISWVGGSYTLHKGETQSIIDSAQRCQRNQFASEAQDDDMMIFSFYPTKPISSCDGGMVVSNNKSHIDFIRQMANNGMSTEANNWERQIHTVGHKMYMNSLQAYIALRNLRILEEKQQRIAATRELYNEVFGLQNKSCHLYILPVKNNKEFIASMQADGITCGIHYKPLHQNGFYNGGKKYNLPLSDHAGAHTATIPMHEALSSTEIEYIIEKAKTHAGIY